MKWLKGLSFLLGFYFLLKAYSLYSIFANGVDGDGIGIYLGIIEVNDRVPTKDIPTYIVTFAIIGITLLLLVPFTSKLGGKN